MRRALVDYSDFMHSVFDIKSDSELPSNKDQHKPSLVSRSITFQVTDSCNLRCTYCYQGNKSSHFMDFSTAKKFIDYMFQEYNNPENEWLYKDYCKILTIDFIGGEPLLAVDLIYDIITYFEIQFLKHQDCIWGLFHRYSICSNGILYFTPKVQRLLRDYGDLISFSVTVDGCKEYHDKCRIFPDGSGSYDLAMKAAKCNLIRRGGLGTKITISPDNVQYVFEAVKNMYENGFKYIHINCVFEEGWADEAVTKLYYEGKKIVDWMKKENIEEDIYISPLSLEKSYQSIDPYHCPDDNHNWCGGTWAMLALDWKGDIFTCIRFMDSSLNGEQPEYSIGNIDHGIGFTDIEKQRLKELNEVTLISQSEEKCINCEYAQGCAWCSGYNYQKTGSVNKRVIYNCHTHFAWGLVAYYYNKIFNLNREIKLINKKIALQFISENEYNYLSSL